MTKIVPSPLQTLEEKIDPTRCAILVIDMQNDFLHPEGKARRQGGRDLGPMQEMIPTMAELLRSARGAQVPVIYVCNTTLPDGSSSSDVWIEARSRARYSGVDMCFDGSWGQQVIDEVAPKPGDRVVKKYRYSGFAGTNLGLVLRSLDRRSVVCAGTSTNVCVEATAWDAFHHEYYVIYATDACASWDMSLHEATLRTAETRYATLASVDKLVKCWESSQ